MNSQKVVILAKAGIQNLLGKSWTPAGVYPGENRGRSDRPFFWDLLWFSKELKLY